MPRPTEVAHKPLTFNQNPKGSQRDRPRLHLFDNVPIEDYRSSSQRIADRLLRRVRLAHDRVPGALSITQAEEAAVAAGIPAADVRRVVDEFIATLPQPAILVDPPGEDPDDDPEPTAPAAAICGHCEGSGLGNTAEPCPYCALDDVPPPGPEHGAYGGGSALVPTPAPPPAPPSPPAPPPPSVPRRHTLRPREVAACFREGLRPPRRPASNTPLGVADRHWHSVSLPQLEQLLDADAPFGLRVRPTGGDGLDHSNLRHVSLKLTGWLIEQAQTNGAGHVTLLPAIRYWTAALAHAAWINTDADPSTYPRGGRGQGPGTGWWYGAGDYHRVKSTVASLTTDCVLRNAIDRLRDLCRAYRQLAGEPCACEQQIAWAARHLGDLNTEQRKVAA
ncbi:MAG: hypothetical protein AAFR76_01605 [Planctomycetota bacterium]